MKREKKCKMKGGIVIGVVLIAVGLVLQLCLGPVRWELLAWPVNGVVLAVFLLLIATVFGLRSRVGVFWFLSSYGAAIPAICFAVLLTIVMGLTRQDGDGGWLHDMLSFWPFVLVYVYMTFILGLVILRRCRPKRFWEKGLVRNLSFVLNHVGLFVAIVTATLGSADIQRLQMWTTNNAEAANRLSEMNMGEGAAQFHNPQRWAYDAKGHMVELPLAVELKRFIMEKYDDGSPRRYASEVIIYSKTSQGKYGATIDVNQPTTVDGWKIYQKSYYLTPMGDDCQVSVLEIVRDPWLPYVYTGIGMMLVGAIVGGARGARSEVRGARCEGDSRYEEREVRS